MLSCRSVRLSAAAFRAPGSWNLRVKADEPRGDVTLTVRRHRFSFLRGPERRAHLETRVPELRRVPDRDASAGFVTAEWGHLDRVSTVTARLLPDFDVSRVNIRGGTRKKGVLFTGNSFSMQSRAASTKTATKKSEADNNNKEVHKLKNKWLTQVFA